MGTMASKQRDDLCLTSRSSALIRSCSSVVTPARWPPSISARLTQFSRVVGVQPIFC